MICAMLISASSKLIGPKLEIIWTSQDESSFRMKRYKEFFKNQKGKAKLKKGILIRSLFQKDFCGRRNQVVSTPLLTRSVWALFFYKNFEITSPFDRYSFSVRCQPRPSTTLSHNHNITTWVGKKITIMYLILDKRNRCPAKDNLSSKRLHFGHLVSRHV